MTSRGESYYTLSFTLKSLSSRRPLTSKLSQSRCFSILCFKIAKASTCYCADPDALLLPHKTGFCTDIQSPALANPPTTQLPQDSMNGIERAKLHNTRTPLERFREYLCNDLRTSLVRQYTGSQYSSRQLQISTGMNRLFTTPLEISAAIPSLFLRHWVIGPVLYANYLNLARCSGVVIQGQFRTEASTVI